MWIGGTSYMVFWMVVIIGDTFNIPDSVMGITFLAFGGCMPEAISAVIVARKGSGQMGVSNALGANCLAILFSLGLPWFITTTMKGAYMTNAHIHIYSYGMEYTIMILLLAVGTLYTILAVHGYKMRKKVGIYLILSYMVFATFAVLMEFNVFLVGAPADC
jgi:Ca2+/Na+ antiporter